MEQPNLLRHKAIVTKVGHSEISKRRYRWIQLDATIFHPKGGGQPSDEGTIAGKKVIYVHKECADKMRMDQFEILHCFDETQELSFKEGDEVELLVDESKRKLYSRMHTAGHLLAQVVKENFPELEPYHGNHDPKDGYVKFKMLKEFLYDREQLMGKVQPEFQSWLQKDVPVSIVTLSSGMRAIKFGASIMACSGTHVNFLTEIGQAEITDVSVNKKDKIVTVKYRLIENL